MNKPCRQKITVIKKMNAVDVYGSPLPDLVDNFIPYCDRLEVGQEFIVNEKGEKPADFCTWAWHDIFPAVATLRFGGNFPWMKKDGMVYTCCTDGTRPVFFTLERIIED
jgi:uncharacterized repeat protein (TIGR04076 family)